MLFCAALTPEIKPLKPVFLPAHKPEPGFENGRVLGTMSTQVAFPSPSVLFYFGHFKNSNVM